jgi:hypothetical protein
MLLRRALSKGFPPSFSAFAYYKSRERKGRRIDEISQFQGRLNQWRYWRGKEGIAKEYTCSLLFLVL